MLAASSQREIVEVLRQRLLDWEAVRRPGLPAFTSGCDALDAILPGSGFQRGTLIEYLAEGGSGAAALSLIAAREACREGTLVVIGQQFYPPAAANLGIDLTDTVFIRPQSRKDHQWALHQSLSCQGVGAVLAWPERLDDRVFRALQLAAETSGAVGFFIRPLNMRGHPTWSDVRLLVESLPKMNTHRRLRIELLRCRNGTSGASVDVELDDETGMLQQSRTVPMAATMALAAASHSTAGA
ncbi:MAG TPA: hypothetical protein VGI75_05850 [Pirellulales bacterium]|jgi:protein ImuA